MVATLLLGFLLGLDSFRASLGLGLLRKGFSDQMRIAIGFGVCDGVAPLLGMAPGSALATSLSPWTERIGPFVLGGFGIFTFLRSGEDEAADRPRDRSPACGGWAGFGLPILLSLDNLVAGLGLDALGLPSVLSAGLIGVISALMSLAGSRIGSMVGQAMPGRAEKIGGAALTVLALFLAFDLI